MYCCFKEPKNWYEELFIFKDTEQLKNLKQTIMFTDKKHLTQRKNNKVSFKFSVMLQSSINFRCFPLKFLNAWYTESQVTYNWGQAVEQLLESNVKWSDRYTSDVNYFLIIEWPGVNYSAYTTVTTPQGIDQMLYFKTFCPVSVIKRSCEGLISYASHHISPFADSKTPF